MADVDSMEVARWRRPTAVRIAVLYVVLASLWIVFSDRLVVRLVGVEAASNLQTLKGLMYVAATGALLFWLARRHLQEISKKEIQLRSVIDSMPDAVVVAASDGKLVGTNRAARALLAPEGEPLPVDLSELRAQLRRPDGSTIPSESDAFAAALAGHTSTQTDVRLQRHAALPPVDLVVTAGPVQSGPRPKLAVGVLRDVTALRRLERLRDDFLSVAAHELKTPIAAIKGYVQLLRRWAPNGHDERERLAFLVLERQCNRITRLVQELLEVSRLQLGPMQLRRERVELGGLADDILARLQALSTGHQVLLHRVGNVEVEGDPDRLEQVFVNLLDNALRFSTEGARVRVRIEPHGEEALVTVEDQGVGIPRDRHGEVFQPFFHGHAGTDNQHRGGIGIGLHLTREIIEMHGGRIWFESEEGLGSTFHFTLPLLNGGTDAASDHSGR